MENEEHLQQHPQQQHNSTVQPDDGEVYVLFIIKKNFFSENYLKCFSLTKSNYQLRMQVQSFFFFCK